MNLNLQLFISLILGIIIYKFINYEKFCDLKRPEFNYFKQKRNHLLEELKLNSVQQNRLFELFSEFDNYSKENYDLLEYINRNNLADNKDNFIEAISLMLNDNRLWDRNNVYDIDQEIKISNLKHIWLLDKLLSDLSCSLDQKDSEELLKFVKDHVSIKKLKICYPKQLKNYCEMLKKNPKIKDLSLQDLIEDEKLIEDEFLSEDDTGDEIDQKEFRLKSIQDDVEKFGKGYYQDQDVDSKLIDLLRKFENKYSREFDRKDKDDLRKLVLLFIPELKDDLKRIKSNHKDKIDIYKNFVPKRKLFYLLKHHYKVLSIWKLIDTLIEDPQEKKIAMNCCAKDGKCFNFNKEKEKALPQVFGFEKYGFLKDADCVMETKKELYERQNSYLLTILKQNAIFNKLKHNEKNRFLENLEKIFNYFSSKKIHSIGQKKLSEINEYMEGINFDIIFKINKNTKKYQFKLNQNKIDKIIKGIEATDKKETINEILENYKVDTNTFDFTSIKNIEKIKQSATIIVTLTQLLRQLKGNEKIIPLSISKLVGMTSTNESYQEIILNSGVSIKFIDIVLDKTKELLDNNPLIDVDVEKMDSKSKPKDTIKTKDQVFPTPKSLNICNVWRFALNDLRKKRVLSPKDYVDYKYLMMKYCDNEINYKILKDTKEKLRKVYLHNHNGTNILTVKEGKRNQIVNVKDNRVVKTKLLLHRDLIKSEDEKLNGKKAEISALKGNKLGKTKVTIGGKTKKKSVSKDDKIKVDLLKELITNYYGE